MIKVILTDIEGTTTSVRFVYDVLFPYFLNNINSLKALASENNQVRKCFDQIKALVLQEDNVHLNDDGVIEHLKLWVKTDRKETNLKKLQGIIWNKGYTSGELKGHVYDDVPSALETWKQSGMKLAVYSSGSVAAQKLIFGYSVKGDLTPLFSAYFDTNIGHKREADSYRKIATELQESGENILFLSDIEEELDAAKEAGYQTTQLVRPNDGTKTTGKHTTAATFSDISFT